VSANYHFGKRLTAFMAHSGTLNRKPLMCLLNRKYPVYTINPPLLSMFTRCVVLN